MSSSISRFATPIISRLKNMTFFLAGVPRILENTLPQRLEVGDDDVEWTEEYEKYLRTTRININVRQVFPKGFDPGAGIERVYPPVCCPNFHPARLMGTK